MENEKSVGSSNFVLSPEELRRKVEEARAAYERAYEEYTRLTNISRDVAPGAEPVPADGTLALRQAFQIHQRSRVNYEQALQQFTEALLSRYRRIHLKLNADRRVTFCGIWAPQNFLLVHDFVEGTANVCQVCLRLARVDGRLAEAKDK